MCKECGCDEELDRKVLEIFENILKSKKLIANHNREHLEEHRVYGINIMGASGSGKTTFLEKTIDFLKDKYRLGVIKSGLETNKDVERIKKRGIPAYQIATDTISHLDASLIHKALHKLPLNDLDFLFIENIGNLSSSANHDLGVHLNVLIFSVPEGDDKPEKYPSIFKISDLIIINKIDLLPHFDFDLEKVKKQIKRINSDSHVFSLSSKTGEGFKNWINFLETKFKKYFQKFIPSSE